MNVIIIDNCTKNERSEQFKEAIGIHTCTRLCRDNFTNIATTNIVFLHTGNQAGWLNSLTLNNIVLNIPVIPYAGGFSGIVTYNDTREQDHIQKKKIGLEYLLKILPKFLNRVANKDQIDSSDIDFLYSMDDVLEDFLEPFASLSPFALLTATLKDKDGNNVKDKNGKALTVKDAHDQLIDYLKRNV